MPRRRRIPLWPFVIVLVLAVFAWLDYRRAADGELPTSVQLSDEGRAAGRLSQELLAQGKRKEAEALLRERIALEPEAPLLHYALGVAHVTAESWTDAAEAFRIEVGRSPQHVGTRRGLATALGHLSQHAEAAEHWQALLEIAPGDPEAELELGTHLRELGRGEEAKPLLERAAARRSGRAFFELGLLARQAGEREQAVTHLEKALEIQPQQPRAALELGRTLIALGRKKQGDQWLETHEKLQAAEDARRGARVEGQLALMEADRLYSQAREEVKQGRIAEAKSSYGRTLELDPAHHGARIELAWLHMADGQHRPAERELRLVLKQEPEHPQGLLAWGILCVETGRFDEARQSLGRSRASGTWLPTVAQQVGRAWRSVGQEEEARRWESGR